LRHSRFLAKGRQHPVSTTPIEVVRLLNVDEVMPRLGSVCG
jgi:hypothetical protein